jgi:hypothetical protein
MKSTNHEAPFYAIFFTLLSFHPSLAQIFSSAPCSKAPSVYVPPLMSETKFHTQTEPQAKLYKKKNLPGLSPRVNYTDRATKGKIIVLHNLIFAHWVSSHCSLSGILNNYKTQHFWNWICFHLQMRGGRHRLCWVPDVFSTYSEFQTMDKVQKPSDS